MSADTERIFNKLDTIDGRLDNYGKSLERIEERCEVRCEVAQEIVKSHDVMLRGLPGNGGNPGLLFRVATLEIMASRYVWAIGLVVGMACTLLVTMLVKLITG